MLQQQLLRHQWQELQDACRLVPAAALLPATVMALRLLLTAQSARPLQQTAAAATKQPRGEGA